LAEVSSLSLREGLSRLLPRSHRARLPSPPSVREPDNPFMESYACPAGSVFIFTESLLHAGTAWKNPDRDRVAIFNCYNSVWAQWHRLNLSHDLISSMPARRQSLFRGVYAHDFTARPHEAGDNRCYSVDNRSL